MAAPHVKPNELAAWRVRARRRAEERRCVDCGSEFEPEDVAFLSRASVVDALGRGTPAAVARTTLCPGCRDTSGMPGGPPIQ